MHWAEEIANRIIQRNPNKKEYVCAAGISPSGSIHIGNFRDVATSYFVAKALLKAGKRAKLLFSWDEFDRFRKVPANVENHISGFEKYIGYPYVDVPSPYSERGDETYAKYFEKEFMDAIQNFGIEMDFRYQADMYRSGKYIEYTLLALSKRAEIFDILDSHRTQDVTEGEKENYYPVSIYCPECKRDTTHITSLTEDCKVAEYTCKCGHHDKFDFTRDFNCKLAWKIDWPMRWAYETVDFEPGGKDHASPNGSYDTSKDISKTIFNYEAPIFQGYEFIGIKGTTGKMSGSSGLNLTPTALLQIYQPEIILWLYSKTDPLKAFNFCLDDGILRQYYEFDKVCENCIDNSASEIDQSIMYYTKVEGREIKTVPMSLIVQLGSIVDFNVPMMELVFEKIGTPYQYDDFKDRLDRAKYWIKFCSPENANHILQYRNWDYYNALNEQEKKEISDLYTFIKTGGHDLDGLQTELYDIPKRYVSDVGDKNELKSAQARFFKNVYKLLIDKDQGPRLYLFLYAIDTERYLRLLDFSTPITKEEISISMPPIEDIVDSKPVICGKPDPVEPVKPSISFEMFEKIDLRVCLIKKCAEMKNSHNCYKLTLDDGIRERTVVSSIKHDYKLDELIGRKIIVLANLESARFSGVESEGMLLAGTNSACGCKVIFVDDCIPVGTCIR
jgi:lysyl-tRNA synthetase class 1